MGKQRVDGAMNLDLLNLGEEETRLMQGLEDSDSAFESRFGPQHRTAASAAFRAVWRTPNERRIFDTPPLELTSEQSALIDKMLACVQKHRDEGTIYDENDKVSPAVLKDLGELGYWGTLVPKEYGGLGWSFRVFTHLLRRMAVIDGSVAGLSSVHQCIGCVNPLVNFGSEEQKQEWLPRLASGERLSGFALTEPNAGSSLMSLRTTAVIEGDEIILDGEKLFITNVGYGRLCAVICRLKGQPKARPEDDDPSRVIIVELPDTDTDSFELVNYGLHPLPHVWNYGLKFKKFRVPLKNMLADDGLQIAYNGLNLGRVAVCANAGGQMQRMLANFPEWCWFRRTFGEPIASRSLVQGFAGEIAAYTFIADSVSDWCAWMLDNGYRGEIECIDAKVFGARALSDAADIFLFVTGGRALLKGHLYGDNLPDLKAPMIYEGQEDMLAMKRLQSLVKDHGVKYMEPIGAAIEDLKLAWEELRPLSLLNALGRAAFHGFRFSWWYGSTWLGDLWRNVTLRPTPRLSGVKSRHKALAKFAFLRLRALKWTLTHTMTKKQKKLIHDQRLMRNLSKEAQSLTMMATTALQGSRKSDDRALSLAAEVGCRLLRSRLMTVTLWDALGMLWNGHNRDNTLERDIVKLGKLILDPDNETVFTKGVVRDKILRPYEQDELPAKKERKKKK